MNFHDTQTSRVLKQHYEKLLLSYDVYETGIYEEQTDISNQNDLKKGNYSKIGTLVNIIFEYFFFFDHLAESNGTIKNGNKRKDSSSSPPPPPNSNNADPVSKFSRT
jgi:hypothetical protein